MKAWDIKIAKEKCDDYGDPEFKNYISEWEKEEFMDVL